MTHATSFMFRAKPGERGSVISHFQLWEQQRKPYTKGFLQGMLTRDVDDFDSFLATVVFDTTDNYVANSNDPEQTAWYEELRTHIVSEPEWFNGNVEVVILA
jgi:hypothetical protein